MNSASGTLRLHPAPRSIGFSWRDHCRPGIGPQWVLDASRKKRLTRTKGCHPQKCWSSPHGGEINQQSPNCWRMVSIPTPRSHCVAEPTPLTAAVAAHQLETVRLLISKGATASLKPTKSDAPIAIALRQGWDDVVNTCGTQGATAEPELLAAASGDAPLSPSICQNQPDFEKKKLLCEVGRGHGHARSSVPSATRFAPLRGQRSWRPEVASSTGGRTR